MPATKIPRPPRRGSPDVFYTDYLPRAFEALFGGHTLPPSWALELGFVVGEERFALRLANGRLAGSVGDARDAVATLEIDRASWELSIYDVLPRVIRFANKQLPAIHDGIGAFIRDEADQIDPTVIRRLPGAVTTEFTDDAGDRATFRWVIGAGGPKTRIIAGDADLWALLESEGKFIRLVKSRIQLEGDVGYLLRLAAFFEEGTLG